MQGRSFAALEDDEYFPAMNKAGKLFQRSQFRIPNSEFRNRCNAVQMTFL